MRFLIPPGGGQEKEKEKEKERRKIGRSPAPIFRRSRSLLPVPRFLHARSRSPNESHPCALPDPLIAGPGLFIP
ncbi:hypothetical protein GIY56_13200 [Paracoccus sp. YIM 132242]|uniref:Uncharacterized protein n=1 Tax=Paracoccus lichenicola TaxID=2665644 RepID=A0A6L6HSF9_9RHOB|nr:hypothetical protein [Paracoccus lichenicola]MTE01240.1 hypothetical protein [Paracoccus lichenicola]